MSDNEQNKQDASTPEPQLSNQRIYIKDASLETPNTPAIFAEAWKPEISMELNTQTNQINETNYEVIITITVTAKNGGKIAFLVELQQAGIFTIAGLGEEELKHALGAFCPTIIFPYARESIDALVTKASFPALMLAPVNFDLLYAQQQEQAKQQAEAAH